jgi:hypothetical protein
MITSHCEPVVGVGARLGAAQAAEPHRDEVGDVAGEVDEHRGLSAELAHRRERRARVVAEEHPRHDAQVGRRGNRQEFGQALHDPQHDDFKPRHEARP